MNKKDIMMMAVVMMKMMKIIICVLSIQFIYLLSNYLFVCLKRHQVCLIKKKNHCNDHFNNISENAK